MFPSHCTPRRRPPILATGPPSPQTLLSGSYSDFAQTTVIEDDYGHARSERRTIGTAPVLLGTYNPRAASRSRHRHPLRWPAGGWMPLEQVHQRGQTNQPRVL